TPASARRTPRPTAGRCCRPCSGNPYQREPGRVLRHDPATPPCAGRTAGRSRGGPCRRSGMPRRHSAPCGTWACFIIFGCICLSDRSLCSSVISSVMRHHNTPLAYSYLRFTTPEQKTCDSLRRQVEQTADWCKRNKAQPDGSITSRDEGVSAFRGKHRENADIHALAAFMNAVKSGRVPPGAFLGVEALARPTPGEDAPAP